MRFPTKSAVLAVLLVGRQRWLCCWQRRFWRPHSVAFGLLLFRGGTEPQSLNNTDAFALQVQSHLQHLRYTGLSRMGFLVLRSTVRLATADGTAARAMAVCRSPRSGWHCFPLMFWHPRIVVGQLAAVESIGRVIGGMHGSVVRDR